MNKKQKILTITTLGTAFATAIATISLCGKGNFQKLEASRGIEYGTDYTLVIDKDCISDYLTDDNYHIIEISTTTKSGSPFTPATMVDAGGVLNSDIGATSIVDFKESEVYSYIQFNFDIKGVHSLPYCEVKGSFNDANVSINGLEKRTENDEYSVTVYIDGSFIRYDAEKYASIYGGFTLTSIEFTYVC